VGTARPSERPSLAKASFPALGTWVDVVVSHPRDLGEAARAARAELEAIDRSCSRFRPDSELSRLNRAGGSWVEVSPLALEAVAVALQVAQATGGAVDPTVGLALARLGYDRHFELIDPGGPAPPTGPARAPGWSCVALDPASGRVRVSAGVVLDLGASGKAWAVDRAADAAWRAGGGAGVLVSVGGDVRSVGPPPPGGWPVRVTEDCRRPVAPGDQTVSIVEGALATSSTAQRRWRKGGRALHHIVDPRTGQPACSPWRTVTVAAASCVDANAASTASVVLGPAAPAWLARAGLPARLVDQRGRSLTVSGWPRA
jgi:thiamine biosynthesis lipoprotein